MIKLNKLFGCALSVAVTAGFSMDAMASELARERAASSMYGKSPAEQRMMRSGRVAPPWFRMPPQAWTPTGRYLPRPDFAGRAGYPVRPLPARAPRPPVNLARYQRPMPRNTDARIAQYRPPMPPPAPVWARAPRQPVNLRYQRPVPAPAFNRHALAPRVAQYRPLTPSPAPMWAQAPRQLTASTPVSPAKTPTLQAQKGESQELGKAGDTAELAAFESSPTETPRLQAQKGGSDDRVQTIDSNKLAEPVAAVPPLLARPSWMKQVPDGS